MNAPRPASTVLVIRDTAEGLEVLMGRRPAKQAFGGAWVFPGGVVDPEDHDTALTGISGDDAAWRAGALREVAEEVGIFITDPVVTASEPLSGVDVHNHVLSEGSRWDPDQLAYLSNWVTPEGIPKRFDTRFYLATVSPETTHGPVSPELELVEWLRPTEALSRHDSGDIELIMPTIAHLRMLVPFPTVAGVDDYARGQDVVVPVEPRIVMRDGRPQIEIP